MSFCSRNYYKYQRAPPLEFVNERYVYNYFYASFLRVVFRCWSFETKEINKISRNWWSGVNFCDPPLLSFSHTSHSNTLWPSSCFVSKCLQKELLARIRKENAKTDFEDRNCGRFRRIFPPQDRYQQERYAKLLLSAFNSLVVGKNASMAREIERQYLKKYRVSQICLDLKFDTICCKIYDEPTMGG